jgi:hypothetical protein
MTNSEKTRIGFEIDKQLNAGFNHLEIRHNLLEQNYTHAEIDEGFKHFSKSPDFRRSSSNIGLLSLLISLFFIFSGCTRLMNSKPGSTLYVWGIILICTGIAGLILKTYTLIRK